eukprot:TRINITY_DN7026_c0_g1_i5.p2 TRINITY_DN7026_c0_g1~~TRINITY_DN7026_c0_g1_i5.p2  ORF type:complete len:116 (-),score=10.78 TRINITY_DN7026_c0_g1_i5:423-770(-)
MEEQSRQEERHNLMRIEENQHQSQQVLRIVHLTQTTCWRIWSLHLLICSIQLFLLYVLDWMLDEDYRHLSLYFGFDDENLIESVCVVENVNVSVVFFSSLCEAYVLSDVEHALNA